MFQMGMKTGPMTIDTDNRIKFLYVLRPIGAIVIQAIEVYCIR
jgi:hypothetical protein